MTLRAVAIKTSLTANLARAWSFVADRPLTRTVECVRRVAPGPAASVATDGPRSPGRRQWPQPASDGGADEQRRAALAALGHLTATERACVELRLIRRMPIDEVAAALGLTVADARAILLRALRKVASALEVQPNAAG